MEEAILEREAALAALGDALDAALARRGGSVFVAGEAGIGKTALVRRFVRARGGDADFLLGLCDPLSTPRPLGPLHDIARGLGPRLRQALEAGERSVVFELLLDELDRRDAATVLVVEDLHWADEATLDLLRFLGRRIGERRVLLVLTFRDDELGSDHPLRRVLGEWPPRGARRIVLSPLSAEAVGVLCRGSARDPVELHRVTGGNPFFVTELLAGASATAPSTVRDAVLARAARLAPDARAALELVSVIPGSAPLRLLDGAGLLDGTGTVAAGALDACVQHGLLRAEPGAVAFRHELARLAVLSSLPPERAAAAHAAVLRSLLRLAGGSGALAEIVHHAAACGDAAVLLEHAPRAAREAAAVGAHQEAAAHWAQALTHAAALLPQERRAFHEAHAYELYLTGRTDEAIGSRRAALELCRALADREGEGRNLRWLSRLSWFAARSEDARSFAERALEVLEPLAAGAEYAMACSNRAQLHMLAHEHDEAIAVGSRAVERARALGEDEILSHALNNVGTARLGRDDVERGERDLEESLALALAGRFEEHAARAYTNLACQAVERFDYSRARALFEVGLAFTKERDLDAWGLYMRAWRARLALETGRWDEASEDAEAILSRPRVPVITRMPATIVLGTVRARRGDPGALAALDEAWEAARETGELQRLVPAGVARAEALWLDGRLAAFASELRPLLDLARRRGLGRMAGEVAFWLARAGEPPLDPAGLPDFLGLVGLVGPWALALEGRWRAAADEWGRLGRPYERASALAQGDEDARKLALEAFLALGALPAADRLRRELREAGVRAIPRGPQPSTRAHPAGLTLRQREVLALLGEGLTYGQVARRLFVSAKTVEHHVGAILARLGVASRGEAVELARERGWLA
jgi:DNA-binding CsgD family transcriptional regulator/tetratricopeptide (TPR) repeat protein